MKNHFKFKVSVTLETKTDENYSSWRDVFTKVSDETLVLDSDNITVDGLQKIIKNQMNEVLVKTQNFVETSSLIAKSDDDVLSL